MLNNHKIKPTGRCGTYAPRPITTLCSLQLQNRQIMALGSLGAGVGGRLPDAVAKWLIDETLKLPPVGDEKLPSVASLVALILIDAYHDDMEERMASEGNAHDTT